MLLYFLDFDGCLHPQHDRESTSADQLFCHLSRFECVMRDFTSVEIVLDKDCDPVVVDKYSDLLGHR